MSNIKNKGVIIIRKMTEIEMIERININNPTIEYVCGFTRAKEKATFRCKICGELFDAQAYNIYSGYCGCPKCYKNKGINNLVEKLKINNPFVEYVEGYIEPHKKATFKCKKCGHIWDTTAYEVYIGRSHCPCCSKVSTLFSEDEIREKLKQNNPDISYIGGYSGSLDKAEFCCNICKYQWETTAFAVYSGKTGCPKCASSKGEKRISKYLDNKGIDYEAQWIFEDCKNIFNLPFDFFLPKENICIEYDGEYHFMPIKIGNITFEQAKENLNKLKYRDEIKTNYCKNNNIKLIRIPYMEFNNIEKILDNYFDYAITA